jgi:hypothetical protein
MIYVVHMYCCSGVGQPVSLAAGSGAPSPYCYSAVGFCPQIHTLIWEAAVKDDVFRDFQPTLIVCIAAGG